jgi:hypothetical protein
MIRRLISIDPIARATVPPDRPSGTQPCVRHLRDTDSPGRRTHRPGAARGRSVVENCKGTGNPKPEEWGAEPPVDPAGRLTRGDQYGQPVPSGFGIDVAPGSDHLAARRDPGASGPRRNRGREPTEETRHGPIHTDGPRVRRPHQRGSRPRPAALTTGRRKPPTATTRKTLTTTTTSSPFRVGARHRSVAGTRLQPRWAMTTTATCAGISPPPRRPSRCSRGLL